MEGNPTTEASHNPTSYFEQIADSYTRLVLRIVVLQEGKLAYKKQCVEQRSHDLVGGQTVDELFVQLQIKQPAECNEARNHGNCSQRPCDADHQTSSSDLLSVAAPHASSCLLVVPSPDLGLHLESNEHQMAIRWWLGLDTSGMGESVVIRHDGLRNEADTAALAAEARKLDSNGPKCQELGWSCILLAVETYGNWGKEAHDTFSRLASYLAVHQFSTKSAVLVSLFVFAMCQYNVHVQQLVSSLEADDECAEILLQASYLDDGALAGTRQAVLRALLLVEELGPALGLHVNLAKCELFSRRGNTSFSPEVRCSLLPNLDILGLGSAHIINLQQAVAVFNTQVSLSNAILVNSVQDSSIPQKVLSGMIQAQQFPILLESSYPANRAHLLSVAAPHASSWLSVVPSPGLGLHLESNEYQMAIRHGGDVVTCHNRLRDEVFNLCCRAHLSVGGERGHGLTRDLAHTRPADILIAGWDRGKPAALDLTITSPLCSAILRATAAFYLAIHQSSAKSAVVAEIYGWFNMALVHSIPRAILVRELPLS
ncbi:hypothetical protein EMCRGX_G009374 [Ephydatia muelleri]